MATKIEDAIYCLRMDSCAKCIGYDECMEETGLGRCFEATGMGADALEKQLPKKPKGVDFDTMGCPTCGVTVLDWFMYCAHCGQKLDWEGVKK